MRSSDKKFLEIFDSHSAVMLIVEPKSGKIILANNSAAKYYGYSKDELQRMTIQEINTMSPDEVAKMRILAQTEERNYFEFKHRLANSEIRNVEVYSYPIIFDDEQVLYSIVYDVTDMLIAENAVKESESQLVSFFDNTDDLVWAVDREYRLIRGNNKFQHIAEHFTGRKMAAGEYVFAKGLPEIHFESWRKYIDRAILKGERFRIEEKSTVDNETDFIEYLFSPIIGSDGTITGAIINGRDITVHKKIQEELNFKLQNETMLLQNLPVVLYSAYQNPDKDTVWISDNIKSVTGFSKDEYLSEPLIWRKRLHPDDYEKAMEAFANIGMSEKVNVEYRWKIKSGEYRWFLDIANVITKDTEKIYSGFFIDINENKLAIENKFETEEKYKVLIDNANESIYVVKDYQVVFANKMCENLTGYTHNELIGKRVADMIPLTDIERIRQHHNDLITGKSDTGNLISPILTKSGEIKYCRVNAVGINFDGGPASLNMATDITERIKTEELFNSRLKLLEASEIISIDELLVKTIDEAEKLTSSEVGFFHFIDENTESLDLKQWSTNTMNEMCSAKPYEKHYPMEKAGVWADCVRQNKVIIHNDFPSVPGKKGYPEGHAEIKRELTIPIIRGGRAVAILGVGNKKTDYNEYDVSSASQLADLAWDITQKKISEDFLRHSENNLRKLNDEKDKFFSIIAHDLRSPFTAFIGLTETIAENINSMTLVQIRDYMNRINNSAVNLFGLLNNLLEWSLNQRGLSNFEPKVYDLKKVIEESYEPLAESVKRKDINVSFNLPDDIAVKIDKSMFETIMRNLISNAAKFNNRGGNLNISAGNGKDGNVKIYIEDTGIGMDNDLLGKIFNISEKTKRPGTDGEPSSGLGLPLCKEYVEKHGGTINIESEQDKGTTICVTLPIGN
jgi:PAS domain S-box-containing protein